MPRLLIVEDDARMARTLEKFFSSRFDVSLAWSGETALQQVWQEQPDVVVLDVTIPDFDGVDVCRRLRSSGFDVPILFLTAKDTETDVILGLEAGGDDYITKPASLRELDARIQAALRRSSPNKPVDESYSWDEINVDFKAREVRVAGSPVLLAAKEFDLLQFLIRNRGQALTRDELLKNVWGYLDGVPTRTLDTHVLNIRRKLCGTSKSCNCIETVYAVGYKFVR